MTATNEEILKWGHLVPLMRQRCRLLIKTTLILFSPLHCLNKKHETVFLLHFFIVKASISRYSQPVLIPLDGDRFGGQLRTSFFATACNAGGRTFSLLLPCFS